MPDVKEVINGLEMSYKYSNVDKNNTLVPQWIVLHALALLKAQEPATVEPKRIELANETKEWLDEMDAVDALGNIADICIDWDGYRTADGLGGLINEIWAYARYCADRLEKAQGAVKPYGMYSEHTGTKWLACGACNQPMVKMTPDAVYPNYCPECGRAVKWE